MSVEDIRVNRTWVAIVDVNSSNDYGRMFKFDLPNEVFEDNSRNNAVWYYMNRLDGFSTMSNDRMINADDIRPAELLDLIPVRE